MLKKLILLSLLYFGINTAIAGSEDWVGTFTIQDTKGNSEEIIHASDFIEMMSMRAESISFTKGSQLNDVIPSDDGKLGIHMNVEAFEQQVKKLGKITNKDINLGPTYPKND